MEKAWLKSYPEGVPQSINTDQFENLRDVFEKSVSKFKDSPAYTCMGATLTFNQIDELSRNFASFLQNHTSLEKGDRIAIQMPNILQFPIALFGALRAGYVVVNTNPLYTQREMEHQFKDSGAKAIVIVANFAHNLEPILDKTDIETVVVTELGDSLGFPKSLLVNKVVKHVKKMVPPYKLKGHYKFNDALAMGAKQTFQNVEIKKTDIAFLQYTGGTTGVSKGAMLTQDNVLHNMMQIVSWMGPNLKEREEVICTPLPLYHIFSLTVNCMAMMYYGAENILITNPRDIPGFIKELKKRPVTIFGGLNTLFNALMNHDGFTDVDWSRLKVTVAGGMALQTSVGQRWEKLTGCRISEGYGLTETSPVAAVNPLDEKGQYGTIGIPVPSTLMKIVGEQGQDLGYNEEGEICIKGPQVMKGYWQRPEETEKVIDEGGWFHSGDIAIQQPDGFFKIVDRKKDMILVSGFNVYPNEIEDVISGMDKVLEVAAIGVKDSKSGEVVKVCIVPKDGSLTADEVIAHSKKNLAGYKVPRHVEFREELPKSNVGKILRRKLRDAES
ncbi:MAG: long-chain-fatty-acid--CoA ligase [Bdellovibrionaceae bacterium]|nr:long-chain-fatty-acid--CoA ligase [Pseudobdellovibrionaceae bacterium]|tara:strand:- start:27298 stop:28965 length:1668 start_codon:yes stop_codon:yes gene_type:complete